MALNEEQKQAVEQFDGHVCVVAGAGSGKTRVLTERIVALVNNGVAAKGILAFTFTKKAAEEMQERLGKMLGEHRLDEMFVGTIHSLFFRILREHLPDLDEAYGAGMVVAKEWQQKKFLKEIHEKYRFNREGMDEIEALRVIGRAKNMGFSWRQMNDYLESQGVEQQMVDYYTTCYREYDKKKRDEGLLDFDDMLIMSRNLFRDYPDILERQQARFTHISVDEFQDINPVQEQLIDMLQEPHGNLFVVGDARQSIYAFRASDPSFILNFHQKYPDTRIVSLHRNYRCGEEIMDHANRLIAHNPEGVDPMSAELGIPGKVNLLGTFSTADDEAHGIAETAMQLYEDGRKWRDCAVLYRCNHQSRPIEDALIRANIPYEIIGSMGFYGRAEVKDVLAFLEVAHHGDDTVDFKAFGRIVNKPTRYLGKKFCDEVERVVSNYGGLMDCLRSHHFSTVNRRSVSNVTNLWQDLRNMQSWLDDPVKCIQYIRNQMGYERWWVENRGGEDVEEIEVLANLNELQASALNFSSVEKMLNYVAEITRKYTEKGKGNKVKLMSLHRAKGLEFPVVFMAGMSEAFLPHIKSTDTSEERRLAYVGVTRAKEELYLSYYEVVRDCFVGPSIFFPEMGMDLNDIEQTFKEVVAEKVAEFRREEREWRED